MENSIYIIGILFALFDPALYSLSNIIDNYYVNHAFKHIVSVVVYGTAISILFLPVVWLLDAPQMLSVSLLPIVGIIALIDVLYQFPYFAAMKYDDTSIVASLFSLGRIIVPVLAFFIVGEQLHWWQYIGFVIVTSASLLASKQSGRLRLNRSFFLMLLVVILLAFETVLYKYSFEEASWGTVVVWAWVIQIGLTMLMLFIPGVLKNVHSDFGALRKKWNVFIVQGAIDTAAGFGGTYAVSLIAVSVVSGLSSVQPLFVLLFALLLHKTRAGKALNEDIQRGNMKRKLLLYILLLVGVAFILWT